MRKQNKPRTKALYASAIATASGQTGGSPSAARTAAIRAARAAYYAATDPYERSAAYKAYAAALRAPFSTWNSQ